MQPLTFGQWLKRLRSEQDLTQEMLAEKIGCATPTLRSFEGGKRRPSRALAEHIAIILQVPVEQQAEFLRLARLPLESPSNREEAADDHTPAPVVKAVVQQPRLPQAINALIGREAEGNVLLRLLREDRCRLVTIVGAGGMGKTRLALDCANALTTHFADGAGFVALAALDQAHQLPIAVAHALNLELQGTRDPGEQVIRALAQRNLLLVLDNFEHLLSFPEAVAWVKALVERAPGVQLLITSRERLRVREEHSFVLSGLALPTSSLVAEQSDAVLLFLARAQQATGDFKLDEQNKPAIIRICELVDGMPLALELAAAWVRVLSCDEIADEIQRSSDFLALANRDMTPRHRSMRAVFDYSWGLLTAQERQVMVQLTVFRGGCRREAAQAVAQASLPVLAALIDKSLIRRLADPDQQGRYDLHELTRQYVAQRLAEDPTQQQAVQRRHCDFYARFVEEQQAEFAGPTQMAALARIEQEFDNIRAAWTLAFEQPRLEPLLKMVNGLGDALYWQDRYHEGVALFQAATVQLARQNEQAPALDLQCALCQTRTWLGCFLTQVGNVTEIHALFDEVLAQLSNLATVGYDVRASQARAYNHYAYVHVAFFGDYHKAYTLHAQSIDLYRQLGNQHELARMLTRQSRTLHFLGRYNESINLAQEAISISQRQQDQLILVGAVEGLALSLAYLGRFSAAEPYFRTALAAAEATQQRGKMAGVCLNLGVSLTFAGQFHEGQHAWERALAISVELGERNYVAHVTILLGFSALHLGHDAQAVELAHQAIGKADEVQFVRGVALAKILLGSAQLAQGKLAEARTTLAQAIQSYQAISHPDELGWALAIQAYVLRALGLQSEAQKVATEAIQYTRKAESFIAVYSLLPLLALMLFEQEQIELATTTLSTAWQSAFVRHSLWFTKVIGMELEAKRRTLPAASRAHLAAQTVIRDPQNGIEILKRIALLT
ncbi:MAG: tetratricopeptide repeat protein [Chloroflexi bacterium]|nr:tetratricopeptide repeat protein [Chloroflexota bacterium]